MTNCRLIEDCNQHVSFWMLLAILCRFMGSLINILPLSVKMSQVTPGEAKSMAMNRS